MKAIRDKTRRKRSDRVYKQVDEELFIELLMDKLIEESLEVRDAYRSTILDNLVEELADVVEICREIAVRSGSSTSELNSARKLKAQERGGFSERWTID